MRLPLALAAVLIVTVPAVATKRQSGGLQNMKSVIFAKGKCDRLIIFGNDKSAQCKPALINSEFKDSRTGFYFSASDSIIVTFSGMGDNQVKEDKDTAVQPIDRVIVGGAGEPSNIPAVGECRFTNPYKGPAPVHCTATTKLGKFEGNFVTDGNEPDRKEF